MAEPRRCDIEVDDEPHKIGRGKKKGGLLFHLLPSNWGPMTTQRLCSTTTRIWAPEKTRMMQVILTVSLFIGDPRERRRGVAIPPAFRRDEAGVMYPVLIMFSSIGDALEHSI